LQGSLAIDPDQPWSEDAPAVARLREAGAVFVGKTTMSEFGSTANYSDSILYGKVYNPWNLAYTPGGSSGGSAVAVAANLVPLALGTDFGASIAVPSTFCGVFGMKPSTGTVPQYPSDALELTVVGPMARTANDLELVMNIITGPDVRDSRYLLGNRLDYTQTVPDIVGNLRVALVQTLNDTSLDTGAAATIDSIAMWLCSQGACVEMIDLDVNTANDIFCKLSVPKILQHWLDIPNNRRALTGREIQRRAILSHVKENLYSHLVQRDQFVADMRKRMQSYDIILGPATVISADNVAVEMQNISPLSVVYCISKQPTVTIPVGLDNQSMPLAVMIAGALCDDAKVLQVAQAIEQQFPMPACPVIL
jgi:aspartyl-tRNA(Asn)/glutamyl-tRNA(Gln) amidotransferase subunit A